MFYSGRRFPRYTDCKLEPERKLVIKKLESSRLCDALCSLVSSVHGHDRGSSQLRSRNDHQCISYHHLPPSSAPDMHVLSLAS